MCSIKSFVLSLVTSFHLMNFHNVKDARNGGINETKNQDS